MTTAFIPIETATTPNKSRMKAWRDSQAKAGKKIITAAIPLDAHQKLAEIRQETKEPYGDILGRVLLGSDPGGASGLDMPSVNIELPKEFYDVLEAEYGDLGEFLKAYAMDKAQDLLSAKHGDF